jgi:CheY-like chemotaxis protein
MESKRRQWAGAVRAGKFLAVADVTGDERSAAYADAYAANGVRSFVGIPLMKVGRLRAILNIHDLRPHHWTEDVVALAQDMVDRTWSAVEHARSQAELRVERDQSQYIFDSMAEGFGVVDSHWTVLRVNAEGLHIIQRTAHEISEDRKRLVQVIADVLHNAAKYTHEGRNILLTPDVRGPHVLIEVSDNGIGMAPELVSRAFDLFTQAERTSDRSSGKLGLGLALVNSLVEPHHGTVRCESEGIGRGSKFTIRPPRLLIQGQGGKQQNNVGGMQKEPHSLRILIVDDNVDAASMLAMLLEAAGHEVLVEHGSRRALERARKEASQVCLLDIGLPEIDGNGLAQRLRAQSETAKSALIAVTGYGQEKDREQALAAGCNHYLVKPVDTKKRVSILSEMANS